MPTMPPWVQAGLALLAFVIGGGTVGPWIARRFRLGYQAEQEKTLEKRFASLEDMNRLGEKVTGAIRLAELANEQAETAHAEAEKASARVDMLERQVLPRLDKIAEQLGKQGENLAAQTAVLRTFMDEYRGRSK